MPKPANFEDHIKAAIFTGAEAMGITRSIIAREIHKRDRPIDSLIHLLRAADAKDDPKTYFMAAIREAQPSAKSNADFLGSARRRAARFRPLPGNAYKTGLEIAARAAH